MIKKIKQTIILIIGIIFIILGLLGLALPFLQGFLFLFIGFIILSIYSSSVHKWIQTHTKRYPKIYALAERIEAWIIRIVGKP